MYSFQETWSGLRKNVTNDCFHGGFTTFLTRHTNGHGMEQQVKQNYNTANPTVLPSTLKLAQLLSFICIAKRHLLVHSISFWLSHQPATKQLPSQEHVSRGWKVNNRPWRPTGLELMIPHCLQKWLTDGDVVVSFTNRHRSTPHKHLFLFMVIVSVTGWEPQCLESSSGLETLTYRSVA
jgi:hypothetical protein